MTVRAVLDLYQHIFFDVCSPTFRRFPPICVPHHAILHFKEMFVSLGNFPSLEEGVFLADQFLPLVFHSRITVFESNGHELPGLGCCQRPCLVLVAYQKGNCTNVIQMATGCDYKIESPGCRGGEVATHTHERPGHRQDRAGEAPTGTVR